LKNNKKKLLVTGAAGFVGSELINYLAVRNFEVVAASRRKPQDCPSNVNFVEIGDLKTNINWIKALRGVYAVIHTAARVHVSEENSLDSLNEFRKINVDATLKLARQSIEAGVKRFVFISSIKVNGEKTLLNKVFTEDSPPNPSDSYSISKYEAEEGLKMIAKETGLEVVIVRPVFIYGRKAKGNFQEIIYWMQKPFPLPFGSINNSRSIISIDNLVDFLAICSTHPAAANQIFIVSDGEDVSTSELLKSISFLMNSRVKLISVPPLLIKFLASLFGKQKIAQRLCDNLKVDISKAKNLLRWTPNISLRNGLRKALADIDK